MSLKADLEKALKAPVDERVDLSPRTSIRAGGACDLFAKVASEDGLAHALEACAQAGAGWHVLGLGTNTLVSDRGVREVVFKLEGSLAPEELREEPGGRMSFRLGAAQTLSRLVARAKEKGCVGMEFAVGIPGSVGGAVAMNAGTHFGAIASICAEVGLVEAGRTRTARAEELGFGYRTAKLPDRSIVTWARFRMGAGDAEALARSQQAMDDDLALRKRKHPTEPSFGSTFKNPPGDAAGRLIEACGLKGKRHGGAQVSPRHANFIVNIGGASCADVLALMKAMFEEVRARFQVSLAPEVKLIGEFEKAELPWLAA